jgi:hypothetical protein
MVGEHGHSTNLRQQWDAVGAEHACSIGRFGWAEPACPEYGCESHGDERRVSRLGLGACVAWSRREESGSRVQATSCDAGQSQPLRFCRNEEIGVHFEVGVSQVISSTPRGMSSQPYEERKASSYQVSSR